MCEVAREVRKRKEREAEAREIALARQGGEKRGSADCKRTPLVQEALNGRPKITLVL